ncbi:GTPase, partial [bacterium]
MSRKKVIILGAAGRDFHNFNCVYRDNDDFEVVAFTATQIPDIDGRKYPAELAGSLYPDGIPIADESSLVQVIADTGADICVMAYSDRSYKQVMSLASVVNAAGCDFTMLGERETQIRSTKPVISVCAVRTGCGKSQTSRRICEILRAAGKKVVAIRHPMPYGDLVAQKVQRFAELADLERHKCTIEEMEEYEPHIVAGGVIYAGVDYEAILREAEKEADIILWDGGNNDTPFYQSDLHIVVADPHRPGHEIEYFPSETNVRLADAVIINKVVEAEFENIEQVRDNIRDTNPEAV